MSASRRDTSRAAHAQSPRGVPIVEVAVRGPAMLRLLWEVSAEAVRAARPDLRPGEACRRVMLEWCIPMPGRSREATPESESARAALLDPDSGARTTLAVVTPSRDDLAGPVRWVRDDDLHHVEIDGLLRATLRITPASGAVDVLYARTDLFAQMGLPGGRYEPARGAIDAAGSARGPAA